jgi:hypothetical protein
MLNRQPNAPRQPATGVPARISSAQVRKAQPRGVLADAWIFSHPDCTVGAGIAPAPALRLAGSSPKF